MIKLKNRNREHGGILSLFLQMTHTFNQSFRRYYQFLFRADNNIDEYSMLLAIWFTIEVQCNAE